MREPVPFGRFLLLERVAIGGAGELFAARAVRGPGQGRLVAVKRLLPHLADAPAQVERFLAEGRLGARLRHPALLEVLEVGREGGRWFLAMEWVSGVDLGRVLAAPGAVPFPEALAARVGLSLAEGLECLHGAGTGGGEAALAHGDVAPQNVLLGFGGEVKLADLGLAGPADPRAPAGRERWRPPEAAGRGGPATDLWAVAALVRALLGPASESGPLAGLLARALAPDPSLRPATAGALAAALRSHAGGADLLGAWLRARFPEEARRERERAGG